MKSLQVYNCNMSQKGFSDLKVMQSAAGYYIGTTYTDPKDGFTEPGSRDSDYFRTKEDAEKALTKLIEFTQTDVDGGLFNWEAWLANEGLDPQGVGYRLFP